MLSLQSKYSAQQTPQALRGTHHHDTHMPPPFPSLTVSGCFILCKSAGFCAKKSRVSLADAAIPSFIEFCPLPVRDRLGLLVEPQIALVAGGLDLSVL